MEIIGGPKLICMSLICFCYCNFESLESTDLYWYGCDVCSTYNIGECVVF